MRTAKAYDRFWEGITLVQLMRAEWFETASNLIAFSHVAIKKDPTDTKVVDTVKVFQFTLVRLMSLMQGKALRSIGGHDEEFEVLDIRALDNKSLAYLRGCEAREVDPVEVVLDWIQVLVTDAHVGGQIPVPPPILTRVFQTLSRGMVNCHNARKLADVPFPYPLSQMVFLLLLFQSVITPLILATTFRDPVYASVTTFLPLLGMWSITFTAGELEQPFGNDANDLPLSNIQKHYNMSLMMLLDKETYVAPSLIDTSRLTVQALRKRHNTNVDLNNSMTDSLPAWLRLSRFNSCETMSAAHTSEERVESPYCSKKSANSVRPRWSSEPCPSSSTPLSPVDENTLRHEVCLTFDQIRNESIARGFDRKPNFEDIGASSTRNAATRGESLGPGHCNIGVTNRVFSLGSVECAKEKVDVTRNGMAAQGRLYLGTQSLLEASTADHCHDSKMISSLGEPSSVGKPLKMSENRVLEDLHAAIPKLLEPREIGVGGQSPTCDRQTKCNVKGPLRIISLDNSAV